MKPDQELQKLFKVEFIPENIIRVAFLKSPEDMADNNRMGELLTEEAYTIMNKDLKKKYSVLVVFSNKEKWTSVFNAPPPALIKFSGHKQLKKAAIISSNLILKAGVMLGVKFARREEDVKFFDNEEEALAWIKS